MMMVYFAFIVAKTGIEEGVLYLPLENFLLFWSPLLKRKKAGPVEQSKRK